jgi:hypothetical protein
LWAVKAQNESAAHANQLTKRQRETQRFTAKNTLKPSATGEQQMFRQGDVMVSRVRAIPKGAVEVKQPSDKIVLAWGEVTGHSHALAVDEAQEFTFADAGGIVRRFLKVFDKGATVRHEEHAPIPLPPGFYEITRQREYTPEEIRNVAD